MNFILNSYSCNSTTVLPQGISLTMLLCTQERITDLAGGESQHVNEFAISLHVARQQITPMETKQDKLTKCMLEVYTAIGVIICEFLNVPAKPKPA